MQLYENKNYEYDKSNSYNHDHSSVNQASFKIKCCNCIKKDQEKNKECNLPYEERDEYDDCCIKCYNIKDRAGEVWEKSNELADCARKIMIQAKKTEEKAEYYKQLSIEECENAGKLWHEYRCVSNESIEVMREARKYMEEFECCLRECDRDIHICEHKCDGYKQRECKIDNRPTREYKPEHRPERPVYKTNKESGYAYPRR